MIRSGHTVYQASHNLLCQSLSKVFSEHHILLAGERYGVTLPWPLGVHQLTGALLLPPSLTCRGPVTWIRPPQADSLRLCREIDMFAALRTALKVPHRPKSSPDWRETVGRDEEDKDHNDSDDRGRHPTKTTLAMAPVIARYLHPRSEYPRPVTGHADPGELRERMVERLWVDDDVARWSAAVAPWRSALSTVPRHEFIPDTVWIKNPDHQPTLLPLYRDDDPDRWLQLIYATGYDDYVITQVDDGHPAGPGHGGVIPTSSASSPVIVAVMLAALDAHPGHRVLEIGTGTGHNAALLAHRLGAEHITSIEVDPDVASQARRALSDTGYGEIGVITGDGALGNPPGAPYDRIIVTATVRNIPYSWVEQSRCGGRILVPWANSYTGALVALTVDHDGDARGGVVGESSFMWLREQRERRGAVRAVVGDNEDGAEIHKTHLHPHSVGGDQAARFAIGQRVHRCQWRYWPFDQGKPDVDRWRFTLTSRCQRIELT